jgi:hypothetical protein
MFQAAAAVIVDGFTDLSGSDSKRKQMYLEIISGILGFLLGVLILSLVGKWLWNNVVIDLFTIAKPVRSIWQILGLMIFLNLIR